MKNIIEKILVSQQATAAQAQKSADSTRELEIVMEAVVERIKAMREQESSSKAPGPAVNEAQLFVKAGLIPRLNRIKKLHAHNQKFMYSMDSLIAQTLGAMIIEKDQSLQEMISILQDEINAFQAQAGNMLKKLSNNSDVPEHRMQ